MRGRTKFALVAGGTTAAIVAGGVVARGRLAGHGPAEAPPADDAIFTAYAPGGQYDWLCNGPGGWVTSRLMPIMEAGVYRAVAEMIDLQPDDDLLDVGCGPGAFLAAQARDVGRVVGLDVSPLMLRAAARRLADRIDAGTARLVQASAAELPFDDGSFSAVTAVFAPVSHAEAFRVLRPGGRLLLADPSPRRTASDAEASWGTRAWNEADHRRMFEEAGFTDVVTRFRGSPPIRGELLVLGRKPPVA